MIAPATPASVPSAPLMRRVTGMVQRLATGDINGLPTSSDVDAASRCVFTCISLLPSTRGTG